MKLTWPRRTDAPTGLEDSAPDGSLRARWQEPDPEGGTRREAMLRRLDALRDDPSPGGGHGLDLRGLNLQNAQLRSLDLSQATLAGADLSGADLSEANLIGADMQGCLLYGTRLRGAELSGADLRGANLEQAELTRAGLGAANLSGAKLFDAQLEGASLTRVTALGTDFRQAHLADMRARESDFTGADFTGADLQGAELTQAQVHGATFDEADLRGALLADLKGYRRARWFHADIREVNWIRCYMLRRWIMDQNYIDEFRTKSGIHAFVYKLWWFTSDCGRSLWRWSCCMLYTVLVFSAIYFHLDLDYGAHKTWLSPLYFSVVTMTTLGYGDVQPASIAAQIAAICQVSIGYVGLGGLLAIFANKLARRAD